MDYLKEKQGSRGSSKLVFQDHGGKSRSRTLKLVSYDLLVLAFVSVMILRVFPRGGKQPFLGADRSPVCAGGH